MFDVQTLASAIKAAIVAATNGDVISQHIVNLDGEFAKLNDHLAASDARLQNAEAALQHISDALNGDEDALGKLAALIGPQDDPAPAPAPAADASAAQVVTTDNGIDPAEFAATEGAPPATDTPAAPAAPAGDTAPDASADSAPADAQAQPQEGQTAS